jgi:transposase
MVGKIRHKTETRIEAARLFDAGFGYKWVAKQLRLSESTMRIWQDSHKQGRLLGLDSVTSYKKYSAELKLAAVEKFLSGTVKPDVMLEFSISTRAMLNKWLAIYRDHGAEGLMERPKGRPKQNMDRLLETDSQKIHRLELENAVLKKLIALEPQDPAARLAKRKQSGR